MSERPARAAASGPPASGDTLPAAGEPGGPPVGIVPARGGAPGRATVPERSVAASAERIPRSWWIVAVAALALRAALIAGSVPAGAPLTGDEPIYDQVARNLLAGEGYSYRERPWVWKPPGWPITLAGIYAAFGDDRRTVVLCQGAFDAVTVLIGAWLAWRIERRRAAFALAALALALWPPFARESRFLQTEPLFTACVMAVAAAFARFAERPSWRRGTVLGMAGGLAALVRPIGLVPLGGLLIGWLLLRPEARARAPRLAAVALGVALVLLPWTIRNARVFDAFIPVSTGGGELFYMGTIPETDGRWNHAAWAEHSGRVLDAERRRLGRDLDPKERDRALLRAGLEEWRRDPGGSLLRSIKRFGRLVFVALGGGGSVVRWGFLLALITLYALAIARALPAARSPDPWGALPAMFLAAVVVYALASAVFYTNSRYFEPVRPLLLVPAAGALVRWRRGAARALPDATPAAGAPVTRGD